MTFMMRFLNQMDPDGFNVTARSYTAQITHFSFAIGAGLAQANAIMTGWRVGYLAAPKDIAKAIDSFQSHATSNACSISQYATIEALKAPEAEIQAMVEVFDKRRARLLELIAGIDGVQAVEPDGAFYVMLVVSGLYGKSYHGKTITNSIEFADALLESEKVATIPGISFGADDCLRLSYSLSEEDIQIGLARIKKFVSELQ